MTSSCDERGNCVIKPVEMALKPGGFECIHCGAWYVDTSWVIDHCEVIK